MKQNQPVQADFNEYRHGQLQDHFSNPHQQLLRFMSVIFQLFPGLPAIPGFLGSIPGTKEQGLEVDLESEDSGNQPLKLIKFTASRWLSMLCRLLYLLLLLSFIIIVVIVVIGLILVNKQE